MRSTIGEKARKLNAARELLEQCQTLADQAQSVVQGAEDARVAGEALDGYRDQGLVDGGVLLDPERRAVAGADDAPAESNLTLCYGLVHLAIIVLR